MHSTLTQKLSSYLVANNPDIIVGLQADFSMTRYLEDKVQAVMPLAHRLLMEEKPQYIIEELCMNELTKELRPSRFLFIRNILEEEFPEIYERYRELGVLTYETINMIEACRPVFDEIGLTEENEDDRHLRYAITGAMSEYLGK